jgi:hydrogenase maturation protease
VTVARDRNVEPTATGCVSVRWDDAGNGQQFSEELMDIWAEADEVIVVDAARSGAPAGTIHSIMADKEPVPVGLLTSTHSVGVAETVELARSLGCLPSRLLIYGFEVAEVGLGEGLSAEVERAVEHWSE